jgi:ankyrin repeat protein
MSYNFWTIKFIKEDAEKSYFPKAKLRLEAHTAYEVENAYGMTESEPTSKSHIFDIPEEISDKRGSIFVRIKSDIGNILFEVGFNEQCIRSDYSKKMFDHTLLWKKGFFDRLYPNTWIGINVLSNPIKNSFSRKKLFYLIDPFQYSHEKHRYSDSSVLKPYVGSSEGYSLTPKAVHDGRINSIEISSDCLFNEILFSVFDDDMYPIDENKEADNDEYEFDDYDDNLKKILKVESTPTRLNLLLATEIESIELIQKILNEKEIYTHVEPYDSKTRNFENLINKDNEVFITYDGIEHVFDNTVYDVLSDISMSAICIKLIEDPRLIAVHKNNLLLLKSLNHKNLKITHRGETEVFSPLHFACALGIYNIVDYLLKQIETKINLPFSFSTPLHYAASRKQNHKILELLILANAKINSVIHVDSPLDEAYRIKCDQNIKILESHGAKRGYEISIFSAISANNLDMVKRHIKNDSSVIFKNISDQSVLRFATRSKNIEIFKLLFQHGATIDNNGEENILNDVDDILILEYLIKQGADVNFIDDNGKSPLHNAPNVEVAQTLIRNGARIDSLSDANITPLDYQYDCENFSVAKIIKNAGGNFSNIDYAVSFGEIEDVEKFLEQGITINYKSKYDRTLLDIAHLYSYRSDRNDMMDFLKSKGAKFSP